MTTLLVAPGELAAEELAVSEAAFRHLFRARRLAPGERLRIVDGRGGARWATVTRVRRSEARLALGGPAPANEPRRRIELLTAPPRPRRAAWLVEKATELGAAAIRFLGGERAPRSYGAGSLERLSRVARSALEQCERSRLPEVTGVHAWSELPGLLAAAEERWLLDAEGTGPPATRREGSLALVVGPEGGWTPDERRQLAAAGCLAVTLGPTILRVETAAIAGLTLALAE